MMRHAMLAGLVPLVLAGCGGEPDVKVENASIAEVNETVRDAARIEPGQWRTQTEIVSVDIPGMPAEVADAMKRQMGVAGANTFESCVTREQSERPPEELLGGKDNACRYETFELKGGRMNVVMSCQGAGNGVGTMRMTLAGTYAGAAYDLTGTMEMNMGQKMTLKTRVKGARIGACAA